MQRVIVPHRPMNISEMKNMINNTLIQHRSTSKEKTIALMKTLFDTMRNLQDSQEEYQYYTIFVVPKLIELLASRADIYDVLRSLRHHLLTTNTSNIPRPYITHQHYAHHVARRDLHYAHANASRAAVSYVHDRNGTANQQYGNPSRSVHNAVTLPPVAPTRLPTALPKPANWDAKNPDNDNGTCQLCMVNNSNIVFLECGHCWMCDTCLKDPKYTFKDCPFCKSPIKGTIQIHEKDYNVLKFQGDIWYDSNNNKIIYDSKKVNELPPDVKKKTFKVILCQALSIKDTNLENGENEYLGLHELLLKLQNMNKTTQNQD